MQTLLCHVASQVNVSWFKNVLLRIIFFAVHCLEIANKQHIVINSSLYLYSFVLKHLMHEKCHYRHPSTVFEWDGTTNSESEFYDSSEWTIWSDSCEWIIFTSSYAAFALVLEWRCYKNHIKKIIMESKIKSH